MARQQKLQPYPVASTLFMQGDDCLIRMEGSCGNNRSSHLLLLSCGIWRAGLSLFELSNVLYAGLQIERPGIGRRSILVWIGRRLVFEASRCFSRIRRTPFSSIPCRKLKSKFLQRCCRHWISSLVNPTPPILSPCHSSFTPPTHSAARLVVVRADSFDSASCIPIVKRYVRTFIGCETLNIPCGLGSASFGVSSSCHPIRRWRKRF